MFYCLQFLYYYRKLDSSISDCELVLSLVTLTLTISIFWRNKTSQLHAYSMHPSRVEIQCGFSCTIIFNAPIETILFIGRTRVKYNSSVLQWHCSILCIWFDRHGKSQWFRGIPEHWNCLHSCCSWLLWRKWLLQESRLPW